MNHQARELQELIARQNNVAVERGACRSVVVSSGSGGVGRSLFALQTALSLGEHGQKVVLLDANAGVSHTALLAGRSQWRSLDELGPGTSPDEVAIALTDRVKLVCGVSGWMGHGLTDGVAQVLDEWLEAADWCVVDAGPRTQQGVVGLMKECDVPVLVTVPEPIPLAETYAALRQLNAAGRADVSVVLNRVGSAELGRKVAQQLDETAAKFLQHRTSVAATLLDEQRVLHAARSRQAGHFLADTGFGRSISVWTNRLRIAA